MTIEHSSQVLSKLRCDECIKYTTDSKEVVQKKKKSKIPQYFFTLITCKNDTIGYIKVNILFELILHGPFLLPLR